MTFILCLLGLGHVCSLVGGYQLFGGTYCFPLQDMLKDISCNLNIEVAMFLTLMPTTRLRSAITPKTSCIASFCSALMQ